MSALLCPYCKLAAVFHKSSEFIYGRDRDYGAVWACANYPKCDAYCGTHPDGSPVGRLANKALRHLKQKVHSVFDPLWQDWHIAYPELDRSMGHIRRTMRMRAYVWLADQLRIPFDDCHVGDFDDAQCEQAFQIIKREAPTAATIREWAKRRKEVAA